MAFDFKSYCSLLDSYTLGMNPTLNETLEYELAFAITYMRKNNLNTVQLGNYEMRLLSPTSKFGLSTDYPYLDLLLTRYSSLDNLNIEFPRKTRIALKITMYLFINLVSLFMLYCLYHWRIYAASIALAGIIVYDMAGVFLNITDFCVPPLRELIRRRFEVLLLTYHKQPWFRSRESWVLFLADKLRNCDLSDSDKVEYDNLWIAARDLHGKSQLFALAGLELLCMKYSIIA